MAEHANMTKAGLLYHLSSKEELIQQMNEHAILVFVISSRPITKHTSTKKRLMYAHIYWPHDMI
ncbi:TetR/AcrR family transcriptional regulator [Bacillus safensis]|uniref:TetR/AcrR family transcriptional regulator n=1 Tax=Bacillus safensis TaxID=561879 RepID=UPI001E320814|nr:TetR/AcrR family transcriptional regulator [Bacillus safensis]MCY7493378.1 TetR/AcrR family transcriptional regulator [Bacillus safensis]MED4992181.1 TetR/AcrR family transcriptional regulator [Bacillus safensis]UDB47781.1 TetR/AcrR family transcriptional regulator [Bacillus safensis]